MDLPKEAKWAPSAPVWNQSFPSPRQICLKRLSELHLPRFEIRVFLYRLYTPISTNAKITHATSVVVRTDKTATVLLPNLIGSYYWRPLCAGQSSRSQDAQRSFIICKYKTNFTTKIMLHNFTITVQNFENWWSYYQIFGTKNHNLQHCNSCAILPVNIMS